MRSTRNTIINIKRFLVLTLARLLIRMMRLGMLSSSQLDLRKQGRLPPFIRRLSHQAIGRTGLLGRRRYTYRSEAMDII